MRHHQYRQLQVLQIKCVVGSEFHVRHLARGEPWPESRRLFTVRSDRHVDDVICHANSAFADRLTF